MLYSQIERLISELRGRRVVCLATSNRWEGNDEKAKSTQLAERISKEINGEFIDVSTLKIWPCEGNISSSSGNSCGVGSAVLKDPIKNPSGNHRCWASLNHKDDELWRVSRAIFESDCVLFFSSMRWGQTNSIHQKLIERLSWIENRRTTLNEGNCVAGKTAGIIILGHNWKAQETLERGLNVLRFFGFDCPDELSFWWQWTENMNDETAAGYIKASRDFASELEEDKKLKESFREWWNRYE